MVKETAMPVYEGNLNSIFSIVLTNFRFHLFSLLIIYLAEMTYHI